MHTGDITPYIQSSMLEPLVLPNQNLGAIQLLGVAKNTTIPFFKQQIDKILALSVDDKNSVALIQLAASFYTRGLLQHIEPMIQIETDQKEVEMFGIKNLEKVLKQVPKTEADRSAAVEMMNDFLDDLNESVTSLQEEANKILQPKIPLNEPLSRDIVNTKAQTEGETKTFTETLLLVGRAYLHLTKVIEKSSSLPESIPWPIVLIPRTSNSLAAISTAFYTPPTLFNSSALLTVTAPLRLFTLLYSPNPMTADVNQFDDTPRRAPLLSKFGGATNKTFEDQTQWERPFIKVNLKNRSIKITVPAKWLKNSEAFKEYLRHSSYMIAFYAYIKVTLADNTQEYFVVSFDVGISIPKGTIQRFSPLKPVVLFLSPTKATHNQALVPKKKTPTTEVFTTESKDLQKWVITQPETQRLFGITSPPTEEWKKVAAHVTRIYIGTTSGGYPLRDFDQAAPAAYHEFYKTNFKILKPEAAQHTIGWASLQKARKLTSLAFSGEGSRRIDMIRDLNVDVRHG